jgi:hypothetical protein
MKVVGVPDRTTLDPTTEKAIPRMGVTGCTDVGAGLQENLTSFRVLYRRVVLKLVS